MENVTAVPARGSLESSLRVFKGPRLWLCQRVQPPGEWDYSDLPGPARCAGQPCRLGQSTGGQHGSFVLGAAPQTSPGSSSPCSPAKGGLVLRATPQTPMNPPRVVFGGAAPAAPTAQLKGVWCWAEGDQP